MPLDISRLDPDQRAAVTAPDGPVLVFAGAGSGKTRTLTARIAYLIEARGIRADEIVAMTFTRKAAQEMRERCARLLSDPAHPERDPLHGLHIGTFHAQMAVFMRSLEPDVLKRVGRTPRFSIWDEDDRAAAVGLAAKAADIFLSEGVSKRDIASRISAYKNADIALSAYGVAPGSVTFGAQQSGRPTPADLLAGRIWPLYEASARAANAFDFDDLLTAPIYLLGTDRDLAYEVSAKIRHLLVDEFQDTNRVQMHLIDLLSGTHRNLFVVGDDAQSIYGFRGAKIENILSFEARYPGATKVILATNYRSSQPILDLANVVIEGSRQNVRKDLRAHDQREAKKPVLRKFDDETAEARYVVEEVRALHDAGVKLADMAILVRVRAQTRPFEQAAAKAHLPAKIIGGLAFWDRKEVKDLMAYLKLILNDADDIAFKRAVGVPRRGVGDVLLEAITDNAAVRGGRVMEAARAVSGSTLGTAKARAALALMCDQVASWSDEAETRFPADLVRDVLDQTGLLEAATLAGTPEAVSAGENMMEVVNAASAYGRGQLREMVESATLEAVTEDADGARDTLSIATLHGAKGLEWPAVWLAGFEDGLLPYERALEEEGGEDEERRLAYVGITRAKRRLTLTMVDSRFINGGRTQRASSRFLRGAGSRYEFASHMMTEAERRAAARTRMGGQGGYGARPGQSFRPKRPGSR